GAASANSAPRTGGRTGKSATGILKGVRSGPRAGKTEWRNSQMLEIQDQEEMDFINTITDGTNHVWVGLNNTSHTGNWNWVDGSPFNQTL
ncbi:unnamed protein product, partial [Caretta caretta]